MAEERIQFTIGGNYTAGAALKQADADVKAFQNSARGAAIGVQKGFGAIAAELDGPLSDSLRGAGGLINALASGGLWGAAAQVAGIAISSIIGYFQDLKKETEAFRQRMDSMRTGFRDLIQEQVAAKEAAEQGALEAMARQAAAAVAEVDRLIASFRNLAAAEDAAIGAGGQLKIAQITDEFSQRLAEAADEMKPLIQAEKSLAIAVEQQSTAREAQTRAVEREKIALANIEEKIKRQQAAIEAAIEAGGDVAAEQAKLADMQRELAAQTFRLQNAQTLAATSALQHETAVRDATVAVKRASAAWDAAVAANEIANEKVEETAALGRIHDEITRICMRNEVDYAAYIKAYTEAIAKGLTHAEAYAELQKKLNEELRKRAEAETKSGAAGRASRSSASATIHLNTNELAEGHVKGDSRTAWSKSRDQMREDVAEQKAIQKQMNDERIHLTRYMKGVMPKDQAAAYEQMLMKSYSPDQLKQMGLDALSKQLLSTSEQREQVQAIKDILAKMKDIGLK